MTTPSLACPLISMPNTKEEIEASIMNMMVHTPQKTNPILYFLSDTTLGGTSI